LLATLLRLLLIGLLLALSWLLLRLLSHVQLRSRLNCHLLLVQAPYQRTTVIADGVLQGHDVSAGGVREQGIPAVLGGATTFLTALAWNAPDIQNPSKLPKGLPRPRDDCPSLILPQQLDTKLQPIEGRGEQGELRDGCGGINAVSAACGDSGFLPSKVRPKFLEPPIVPRPRQTVA